MKNHSASLKPTYGMDASAQILNLQSDAKAAELNDLVFCDYSQSLKNGPIRRHPCKKKRVPEIPSHICGESKQNRESVMWIV